MVKWIAAQVDGCRISPLPIQQDLLPFWLYPMRQATWNEN